MSADLPEMAYAAALASAPNVGPATLRRLLAAGPPSVAWARSGLTGDVEGIWQRHTQLGITVLTTDRPAYPDRLAGDPEAPPVLFCQGDPTTLDRHPTVALVGTRSPTRYGIGVAAQFGADLAAAGASVVSGLALGIDGAAHEGACASGAPPVAVVAGGLDDPYPRRHARLWDRVATQGAVFSESPAGIRTERWRFPETQSPPGRPQRRGGGHREPARRWLDAHGLGGAGPGHPRRRRAGFDPEPDVGGNQQAAVRRLLPGVRRHRHPGGPVLVRGTAAAHAVDRAVDRPRPRRRPPRAPNTSGRIASCGTP